MAIIKWCCCLAKKWIAGNYIGKERDFVKKELKANSDVNKEYIDEHESDSKILQYDSEEASIKSEESDSE